MVQVITEPLQVWQALSQFKKIDPTAASEFQNANSAWRSNCGKVCDIVQERT